MPHTNRNDVSRVGSIAKYLQNELDYDSSSALQKAMKKGVDSGKLIHSIGPKAFMSQVVAKLPDQPKVGMDDIQQKTRVAVNYEGILQDGTLFDAASSFEFTLKAGNVKEGRDTRRGGMKV